MTDSVEGRLNLGNGSRPRRRDDERAPTPPSPDRLDWVLDQVNLRKIGRLNRELARAYLRGYDLAYSPSIRGREPTTGGGDSDPTGEIVADEHREQLRRRLKEAHDLAGAAVKKMLSAWDDLNQARSRAESAAGMRVQQWDAAEMRAAEARRDRRRVS